MKFPKGIKTYCKTCNAHTAHKLKLFKTGQARAMSIGTRRNVRKHKRGYGGKAKFVIKVKKQTKKPTFLAECGVCKKKHYFVIDKRMKKVDMGA